MVRSDVCLPLRRIKHALQAAVDSTALNVYNNYTQLQRAPLILQAKESGALCLIACNSNTVSIYKILFSIRKLVYLFRYSQCPVERMPYRSHDMVCLMEYLQTHLRSGCHNRVRTVGTVTDNDVFTLILLELHIVLYLSRTVTRS